MLQLYFVRHGETEWNRDTRLQGRLDSPLTKKGLFQARLLAERFSREVFIAVVSSPSGRAVQTAKLLINDRDIPYFTDERLMEIDLGDWQGKTMSEIRESDHSRYDCYYHTPHSFTNEKGEDFLDVKKRVEEVLMELEERFPSGKLLVVTHGVIIKVLLQLICKGLPVSRVWDPPSIAGTSVTIINSEGGKRELIEEGDIGHLAVLGNGYK